MAKVGIGLDFGTSNTTAALFDGRGITYIRLDSSVDEGIIMPTALYLDRQFQPVVGSNAIRKCLEDNTGRKVVLTEKEVGCVTIHMGEMDRDHFEERDRTFTAVVKGRIDSELPGRLFRSMKSYLGDSGHPRFDVFGRKFTLEAILTIILRSVGESIGTAAGPEHPPLFVGRPVLYSGTAENPDSAALERMETTCSRAGLEMPRFMLEPEAAALSYMRSHRFGKEEKILVFDFGGGTLDLCVMSRHREGFSLLGAAGIPRAGDHIDRLIFHSKISPLLGAGLAGSHDFHYSEFEENLLNWQSTYLLNQSSFMEKINRLIKEGGDAAPMGRRLKKLIRSNGTFQLMELIVEAKIRLSSEVSASIVMEEIDLDLVITREELDAILLPVLGDIDRVIGDVLEKSGLAKGDIDRIVCTGGSSRIPAVRSRIASFTGREPEEWDSFRGIAAGLAVASYQGL